MKLSKDYGSHLPILSKVVESTDGPILELGVGPFSTPYLHWTCFPTKRKLVSYEYAENYYRYFRSYRNDFHEVHHVKNWDDLPILQLWEIAFVDHSPEERRGIETKKLANNAKYLILHDTEEEHDNLYHYSQAYQYFKYRYDYKKAYPNTSVLSNFVNVAKILNG